jgi:D-alanyl-D-alanine carboxypeptidase/D-alanyl-D-alanine-endopeptidase (penicillin-binding protein 4)
MRGFIGKKTNWLFIAVVALFGGNVIFGQGTDSGNGGPQLPARPLLQDIKIAPTVGATPDTDESLIKKTASSQPMVVRANSFDPVLADVPIPGYTGILVETLDGKPVVESSSNAAFNPASNVKIATAYAVLKTFGPDYRFPTNVWTDGTIDRSTATLTGNIYVSGRDPIFGYEHAVAIANALNRLGIRNVTGDLIVTDNFAMNYSNSVGHSSDALFATLDSSKRSPAATRVWLNYLANSGHMSEVSGIPGVTFTGHVFVQPIPSSLKLLFSHESAPMREIIKATLCYSNNFLAERLGDMLGGPYAVARVVQLNAGVAPTDFSLQTSSGLGINRVTPVSMMKLLRSLRSELARYRMTFADIMPVAGVDKGTLEYRFDTDFSKGSVVGKTGTLGNTDGGVSSLAGEISTRNGRLLFIVFNQHGSVARFRAFQNSYISLIQGQFGGAVPVNYNPVSIDVRLAGSRIVSGNTFAARNE